MNTEPPPTYIRLDVVRQQVPLSKSGIYEMIANRRFPPPHRLGARAVGWLQSEVTEWVIARTKEPPAVAKAPRPVALKREERAKRAAAAQPKRDK
ncbi:MAG TPA: AlpA family phage regulatory protein [Edaphobacter sp.]|nr:AlpA family phage regulatory protein [Edaphobacter sp.]